MHKSLFEELRSGFSAVDLETRGENAAGVAIKFMELLRSEVDDDDEFRKLASAWYKSVRDNDVKKFKRAWRRYMKRKNENV